MQFTLQTFFLLFVVLWASLAVFGISGFAVFLISLGMAAVVNGRTRGFGCLAVPVLLLAVLVVFLISFFRDFPAVYRAQRLDSTLFQLRLALQSYSQDYGCFPPASVADKNGRPMHSWRVLILPYIGRPDLYQKYKFGEPWDGPNNRNLLNQRPRQFAYGSGDVPNAKRDHDDNRRRRRERRLLAAG